MRQFGPSHFSSVRNYQIRPLGLFALIESDAYPLLFAPNDVRKLPCSVPRYNQRKAGGDTNRTSYVESCACR